MKNIKFMLTILFMLIVLVGCNNKNTEYDEISIEDALEENNYNSDNTEAYLKKESILIDFINALTEENYSKIKEMVGITNDEFISDEDIKEYLSNTELGKVLGEKPKINDIIIYSDAGSTREFKLDLETEDNNIYYEGKLVLNGLSWNIDIGEFYVKEWVIFTREGYTVTIDGIDVTKYMKGDYIKIPNVYQKLRTLKATCMGCTNTVEITPLSRLPEKRTIEVIASEEIRNKANEWYIFALNDIMKNASEGKDISSILKYFDMDFNSFEGIEILYKSVIDKHKELKAKIIDNQELVHKDTNKVYKTIILNGNGDIKVYNVLKYKLDETKYSNTYSHNITVRDRVTLKADGDSYKIKIMYHSGNVLNDMY